MILTNEELDAAILEAKINWNNQADKGNFWDELWVVERQERSGRAVEAAVLAKLADKLRDAERYQQFARYMAGDHTHLDDCFVACTTVEQISAICDKHLIKEKT
jgi:hypothetical protein